MYTGTYVFGNVTTPGQVLPDKKRVDSKTLFLSDVAWPYCSTDIAAIVFIVLYLKYYIRKHMLVLGIDQFTVIQECCSARDYHVDCCLCRDRSELACKMSRRSPGIVL